MTIVKAALDMNAKQIRSSDEHRASTIGASEIGQCARKLFYTKNADDPFFKIRRDAGYIDGWGATLHLRETQHEIRERLRAKGLRRVDGDDFSIVWSPVKGRESVDAKALKAAAIAAGIDVAKFSSSGEPTDRLDIRVHEHASKKRT